MTLLGWTGGLPSQNGSLLPFMTTGRQITSEILDNQTEIFIKVQYAMRICTQAELHKMQSGDEADVILQWKSRTL